MNANVRNAATKIGDITVVEINDPSKIFDDIEYCPDTTPISEPDRNRFQNYSEILRRTVTDRKSRKINESEYINERALANFCFKYDFSITPEMTSAWALEMAIVTETNPTVKMHGLAKEASEQWMELAGLLEKREVYTYRAW